MGPKKAAVKKEKKKKDKKDDNESDNEIVSTTIAEVKNRKRKSAKGNCRF